MLSGGMEMMVWKCNAKNKWFSGRYTFFSIMALILFFWYVIVKSGMNFLYKT